MKQKIKITLTSLLITITLLFPICVFSKINILKNSFNNSRSLPKIKYNIPKEQDICVLLILQPNNEENHNTYNTENNKKNLYPSNKTKGTEEKYIIFKISAHDNYITLANFPKDFKTITQTNEGFPLEEGTLENIHKECGSNYLKTTIENNLNIEIDKIIKLDYNSIFTITNQLGGIKIPMKNTKNKKIYYKILTTEEQQKIMNKDPIKFILLLKKIFNEKTNLSSLFATISNLSNTDISIYDFESRKKGFEKMIKEKNNKTNVIEIKIEKEGNRDKIIEKSKRECEEKFK